MGLFKSISLIGMLNRRHRIWTFVSVIFMIDYPLMGVGSSMIGMGGCGLRLLGAFPAIGDRIQMMDIGSIQIMGGHGCLITLGDGPAFIMAGGFTIVIMDGFGIRTLYGHRVG